MMPLAVVPRSAQMSRIRPGVKTPNLQLIVMFGNFPEKGGVRGESRLRKPLKNRSLSSVGSFSRGN
jgi:hypothetical protein